ncbi:GTP-binding protein LepA [Kribbella sp. CA-293567]|uniref:GTP-binding protein LepA n=1 Tax=Kribbella sp. CA-293567 TaxID=3002436 RepID=UPI0022DD762B|nr:GTP-binding protein LepA [Kribbella sp. CA-293567]WBQ07464.1 GTP-binding protein LepA [Kribbella sp. CA-293567]
MTPERTPAARRSRRGRRRPFSVERRLTEHVDKLAEEHPPIPVDSADYSMVRPRLLAEQFGPVVTYMSRVELEVERNVLELNLLLPDPPAVDKHFYADVWLPQETHHGLLLDRLQSLAGLPQATPDLTHVSFDFRLLGQLGRWNAIQDVSRMLYYLTGVATEQSAILAYNKLHHGLLELGEKAVASTIIAPIRRQEPGHFAYYKIAAQGLWSEIAPWQKWLVRTLRRYTFEPVGAYTKKQWAQFGDVMHHLGITTGGEEELLRYAQQIGRFELELMWAHRQGLRVPTYVLDSLRSAARLAAAAAGPEMRRA